MSGEFSFSDGWVRLWLAGVFVAGIFRVAFYPPSFWLCVVGAALLLCASIANSARTGQWFTWQVKGSLNLFEGWAASTGAVLASVPVAAVFIRIFFSEYVRG